MVYYYIILTFITFLVWGFDKFRAKFQQWRVPEKSLYGLILLGGGIGALAGMAVFRHKTRKPHFKIAAIICILLHLFIFFYLLQ
jgi:uncharacterized membrane protein YsdA (DUF1294 family)